MERRGRRRKRNDPVLNLTVPSPIQIRYYPSIGSLRVIEGLAETGFQFLYPGPRVVAVNEPTQEA